MPIGDCMQDIGGEKPRLSISVAMATYNGAQFLQAQLDSILAQSVLPNELVITDDRSTDEVESLVQAFIRVAPFAVHFERNAERLGFARNFMRAISLCNSDLIFLCDQDDVWRRDKVEQMRAAFADETVLLAYSNATVIDAAGEQLHLFYDAATEHAALAVKPPHPWHASFGMTQAFRASLRVYDDLWPESLNHVATENEVLAHDQWYFFLAQLLGRVAFVDHPLVGYRQHGGNVVGASWQLTGRGLFAKLKARIAHGPRHDELKRVAAERRATILDRLAHRLPSTEHDRAIALAADYRKLSERLARRYRTYQARHAPMRLASLLSGVTAGDYGGRPWAFDPRSVARDLAGGVFALNSAEK